MSRNKKILILIHLTCAFTYLCCLLILPYVREVLSYKSEKALYETVVNEHSHFFKNLPENEQKVILDGYSVHKLRQSPSFFSKIGHHFFAETSPFALAWLFFSIAICFFLLCSIEGASLAAWLLPILVLCYGYFSFAFAKPPQPSLFPSENYVLVKYITSEEEKNLGKRETLLLAWERYLTQEWAGDGNQVDKGLFAFNVARLKWILAGLGDESLIANAPSLLLVIAYFIWNLLFAWMIYRKEKTSPSTALSVANS